MQQYSSFVFSLQIRLIRFSPMARSISVLASRKVKTVSSSSTKRPPGCFSTRWMRDLQSVMPSYLLILLILNHILSGSRSSGTNWYFSLFLSISMMAVRNLPRSYEMVRVSLRSSATFLTELLLRMFFQSQGLPQVRLNSSSISALMMETILLSMTNGVYMVANRSALSIALSLIIVIIQKSQSCIDKHQIWGQSFVTTSTNYSKFIRPSLSLSAYSIICSISACENLSPTLSQISVNYSTPNDPALFLSKTSKSCCRLDSLWLSPLKPKMERNVQKSISVSEFWACTMWRILPASFSRPSALMAVDNSSVETLPLLSQSKMSKHSLSLITSSAGRFLVAQMDGSKDGCLGREET